MGVVINHTITFLTSPLAVSMALIAFGFGLLFKWRRLGQGVIGFGLAWLYCMSSGWMFAFLGMGLEREFPPIRVEELPKADAVVVLGGGVGGNTNTVPYAELYGAADRVVHAARIWKSGKAPVIIPSGEGELQASLPLLRDLDVPESAVLVENHARNTEENARFVADYVKGKIEGRVRMRGSNEGPDLNSIVQSVPRILLVTSAWHMRRALLLFRKYAPEVEVVPAACDYEATVDSDRRKIDVLLPGAESLMHNSYMIKEYIGYWGYKLLR